MPCLFTLLGNDQSPWSHAWAGFLSPPSGDAVVLFWGSLLLSFGFLNLFIYPFSCLSSVLHWIICPSENSSTIYLWTIFAEPHQICLICPYNLDMISNFQRFHFSQICWITFAAFSSLQIFSLLGSAPRGTYQSFEMVCDAALSEELLGNNPLKDFSQSTFLPKGNCFCCCRQNMAEVPASSWRWSTVQIVFWTIQVMQIEAENPRKGWDVVTAPQGPCLPTCLALG